METESRNIIFEEIQVEEWTMLQTRVLWGEGGRANVGLHRCKQLQLYKQLETTVAVSEWEDSSLQLS